VRLAIDTGGTFTDLVIEDEDGVCSLYKAATVPEDPVQGILDVLETAARARGVPRGELLGDSQVLIHGTTRSLNAVLSGTTAKCAFLTTLGHPDVLLLREGGRTNIFDLSLPYPEPYVPRSLTFEVPERIGAAGEVVTALDEDAVVSVIARLRELGVEAVGVCLLWSIVNPAHELRVGELLREHFPEAAVTLSHQLNPCLREYRRASSTCIDASLKPIMASYIGDLDGRLRSEGFSGRLLIVTSSGGVLDAADVAAAPIHSLHSGPAMAPVAGRDFVQADTNWETAVVADTGGTSYDVSVVRKGQIPWTRETWIGERFFGHMTGFPSVDVRSVGAGGGSIAWVDAAGLLHVGPESAGASPGPACYGRGGTRPTVTDADLVLGFLNPDYFLGGRVTLDKQGAIAAIEEQIARPLGMTALEAASGIHEIASAHMSDLIRKKTVEVGYDPRDFALYAFGGAGPVHAHSYARGLGLSEIVIPLGDVASVYSAYGVLASDVVHTYEQHHPAREPFDYRELDGAFEALEDTARAQLRSEGFADGEIELARHLDLKYSGQLYEVDISLEGPLADGEGERLAEKFSQKYDELYGAGAGYRAAGVEVTNCRLYATGKTKSVPAVDDGAASSTVAIRFGERPVFWPHDRQILETPIYRPQGRQVIDVEGPAIIELADTCVPIPAGSAASSLADGSIIIQFRER
jgi:N-methylhydantoinase A